MKKVWIIALLLCGGIAAGFFSCKREPSYARESYSYWFRQFYTSGSNGLNDAADRDEARFALHKMGTNIYPLLIKECFSKGTGTKFGEIIHNLSRLFVGNKRTYPPYIPPERIHEEAGWAIRDLAPSSQTLLPLLTNSFGNDTIKYRQSLFLLGCVGENRDQVVPYLVKALNDSDPRTRELALQSLLWLGDPASAALPDLLKLFQAPNEQYPLLIMLLGNIGPAAKAAMPKLEKLCLTPNGWQFSAAAALYQIDPGNKIAINVLTNSAEELEKNAWVLGQTHKLPVQFILPLTNTTNEMALTRAIGVLEKNYPQAAINVLLKQTESTKVNVQLWAAGWILRIDRNHSYAQSFILNHFKKGNRETIWDEYAIQQLGEASPDAKEIISRLNSIANQSPDLQLQTAAKQSLKRIKIRELMRKEGWKENFPNY